ncbi:KRAB-A domain-containing protein 2-like [Oratosquilla oratoria]|uniref:KRAB-A domain-containing protein 2-like n=1 Tax=Oratosquilla oratoria TaxID=337810 RepID=UPI003F75BE83
MANPTECHLEAFFREELLKRYALKKSVLLPKEKYNKIIAELTATDTSAKKTPHEYYLLKKYEVLKCGDVLKLIRRRNANEEPIYFPKLEYTYDIIKRVHIATVHGGRDKMVKELAKKNMPIVCMTPYQFTNRCESKCQRKRPTTKGTVVRPILTKNFGSRSQVDPVDMQSMKQGNYNWIMVYQDHLTKFCVLASHIKTCCGGCLSAFGYFSFTWRTRNFTE